MSDPLIRDLIKMIDDKKPKSGRANTGRFNKKHKTAEERRLARNRNRMKCYHRNKIKKLGTVLKREHLPQTLTDDNGDTVGVCYQQDATVTFIHDGDVFRVIENVKENNQ